MPQCPVKEAQRVARLAYNNEGNDCGVRALAVACGVNYADAYKALADTGRAPYWGVTDRQLGEAVRALGCRRIIIADRETPGVALDGGRVRTFRAFGMHLQNGWPDAPAYMMVMSSHHVAGVWRHSIVDWARDSLQRIVEVWEIERP